VCCSGGLNNLECGLTTSFSYYALIQVRGVCAHSVRMMRVRAQIPSALSGGAIAGIVIACVAFVVIVGKQLLVCSAMTWTDAVRSRAHLLLRHSSASADVHQDRSDGACALSLVHCARRMYVVSYRRCPSASRTAPIGRSRRVASTRARLGVCRRAWCM
jgi:hypothetical protein